MPKLIKNCPEKSKKLPRKKTCPKLRNVYPEKKIYPIHAVQLHCNRFQTGSFDESFYQSHHIHIYLFIKNINIELKYLSTYST